jgi:hypothetical protein
VSAVSVLLMDPIITHRRRSRPIPLLSPTLFNTTAPLGGVAGDLYDIYEDIRQFMTLMMTMAKSFATVMHAITETSNTVGNQIVATAGLVNGMAAQIVTMAGRVTATIMLM